MEKDKSSLDKTPVKSSKSVVILLGIFAASIVVNILFVYFAQSAAKTVQLLKNELQTLNQQQQILASSQEIYSTYEKEIEIISQVFPNEETIAIFVAEMENQMQAVTSEYSFKFKSDSPINEGDKLYLPLTITMKTDFAGLQKLLSTLEKLPYMTHVSSIVSKNDNGFLEPSEMVLVVKVYVQKPFTTK